MRIRKMRTGLVHSIGMVYSGMGIPQGCQLIERFPQIFHQCGRGRAALKLFLRPSVSHSGGLDFQKALLTSG